MSETVQIGSFNLNFEHELKGDVFISHDLEILGESNACIYLPAVDDRLSTSAPSQLAFLQKEYPGLKQQAFEAIAFLGHRAGTWEPDSHKLPPLVLVKIVLREKAYQLYTPSFQLFYTDPVDDVYGLWSVEFLGTTAFGVRRRSW